MKRLILSLAVAAAVAGPLATSATSAYAQSRERWESREDRGGRDRDRREDQRRDYEDRRGSRDERWDRPRDRYDAWDRGRHNGYYYNNRWYYGPPPQAYYSSPQYRPGYAAWRRGSSLPPYYRGYVVNDYDRYHLRRPPSGYAWYRVGDDYLLAAVASGIIFEIINN